MGVPVLSSHKLKGKRKILIKAGLLITRADSNPLPKGRVLIEGERISAVGQEEEIKEEADTLVLNLEEQTVLPGLIDAHNHLSLDTRLDNYLQRMNDPLPALAIRALETLKIDLSSGVTTSRCLGDKGFLDGEFKKAINEGRLEGPRLVVATRGMRAWHGHGYVGYPFTGPQEIRMAARENLLAGADIIKIFITGTLRGLKGLPSYFSREEIQVAVEEAHRVGVPVSAHCIGGPGFQWAIECGVDVIEHGYFLTDQDIELLAKADRWLVMTPSVFLNDDRLKTLPSELAEGFSRQRAEVRTRMEALVKSGVKFAVGTDAHHGGLALEMKYLVDMGASPKQAIEAGTYAAAQVCGLAEKISTLEPGKYADLVGVQGNPLEDITSLQRVQTVILNGQIKYGASDLMVN
ncbi:MAG: amidohydrolase family protein [Thermodesulfobacteriota bacterium]